MKIFHFLAELGFSGGEVQLRYLIRHLQEKGHQNELVLIDGAKFHCVAEEFGLPVHHVNFRNPFSSTIWRDLPRAVRAAAPDVLHFGCGKSLLWGGLATRRTEVPVRITTRRIDYPIGTGLRGMRYRRLVHHTAANCRSVYQRVLGAGVPDERVTLVHEGLEIDDWRGLGETRCEARIRLDIPPGAVVISQAATLRPRKGQRYLMEAFARVADDFPEAVLVLAGEGPDASRLRELARRLRIRGRVRIPGRIAPVQDLYAATDVFCMGSFHEGLSNACMEASAAGLPQVVSSVGGLPEIVDDGVTGQVVRPGDVDGLAAALQMYLQDERLRQQQGEAGADHIASTFSAQKMATEMEQLFLRLLPQSGAAG